MKKYFANVKTMEELKKAYKTLCLQLHPDKGGSAEEFAAMKNEYEATAKELAVVEAAGNFSRNAKADGSQKTAEEIFRESQEAKKIIDALLNLDGIEIEICGNWIWVSGNTYQHKTEIRALGCHWASKKMLWYWHSGEWRKKTRKEYSMEEIRTMHGSKKLQGGRFIPPTPARGAYMPSLF